MRIIGGKLKGHRLVSFSAEHIRPTTDRVKETLFNKLMTVTEGARFLDLFSGTGALALEAWSRGAELVTAVECHPKSLRILRENLTKLRINSGLDVVSGDVFKFLARYAGEPFDVILADPPFTKQWAHRVMTEVARSKAVGAQTQVILESSRQERLDEAYPPLVRVDQRRYGDKNLSFFACRD